ncbi:MAG: hypothetical protein RMJ56_18355 [Gemmataceae bacterium]|nr:hypothetical protein [Gemmata sp.]MDW8199560.1 hypothetical protein [Gemmataceae bacterium]
MSSDNPTSATVANGSPAATTGYEFTPEQNVVIRSLGSKMKLVGLILLIFGALNLINAFLVQIVFTQLDNEAIPADIRDQLAQIGQRERWILTGYVTVVGIVFLCVGAWTRSAGESFGQIVATSGNDINHLMEGFKTLNKMYSLIATVLVAAILAYLVLVIAKIVLAEQ